MNSSRSIGWAALGGAVASHSPRRASLVDTERVAGAGAGERLGDERVADIGGERRAPRRPEATRRLRAHGTPAASNTAFIRALSRKLSATSGPMPGMPRRGADLAELHLEVLEDAEQAVDAAGALAHLGDGGSQRVDVEAVGEVPVAGDRGVAERLRRVAADHDDLGLPARRRRRDEADGRRHRVRRHKHDVRHGRKVPRRTMRRVPYAYRRHGRRRSRTGHRKALQHGAP